MWIIFLLYWGGKRRTGKRAKISSDTNNLLSKSINRYMIGWEVKCKSPPCLFFCYRIDIIFSKEIGRNDTGVAGCVWGSRRKHIAAFPNLRDAAEFRRAQQGLSEMKEHRNILGSKETIREFGRNEGVVNQYDEVRWGGKPK